MRIKFLTLALLAGCAALPLAVAAQEEEAPKPVVYSTYFECDSTNEWLADAIVAQVFKPVYDAAVADGSISAWGWLSHHTGGHWRRGLYRTAPTFEAAWTAGEAIGEKIDAANAAASAKFGTICHTHDDYIWQWVNGSNPDVATNSAVATGGVSQYLVCDMARQERADELMAEAAPIYNRHVAAGELVSWGWLEHVVGGEYRRLLTLRGATNMDAMGAWGAINDDLDAEQAANTAEFNEICTSHQDYVWNIVH